MKKKFIFNKNLIISFPSFFHPPIQGCGNGKYLNVNHSVYKVGVDRCNRLTDIAREKENEVGKEHNNIPWEKNLIEIFEIISHTTRNLSE